MGHGLLGYVYLTSSADLISVVLVSLVRRVSSYHLVGAQQQRLQPKFLPLSFPHPSLTQPRRSVVPSYYLPKHISYWSDRRSPKQRY
ncbi:hypothetical protein EJ06DRAFT_129970 [Trichodelitschia bisporula]|uniref:Uncharacterized protein n=1 Tax=Trichodelitschia bisporula TaxID=703511 RepID=A0A6G1HPG6_9PEZI|nr:hypothetical protein EJ06DRAFT_129970 [Trichodelitschia bisporula]